MSRRGNSPKLELNLNPSTDRASNNQPPVSDSPNEPANSSREMSPESSCVSSEPEDKPIHYTSTVVTTSMVLLGCPRCFMYVMLSDVDPKCPKCKSTVLLDFLNEDNDKKTSN